MFTGDASLSAGSQQTEPRAASLAALAGSLAGHETHSPAAQRVEVTADVATDVPTSDTASAASWPDDPLPSTSARSALLKSIFLYGSSQPPPDLEAGPSTPTHVPEHAELTTTCETNSRGSDATEAAHS